MKPAIACLCACLLSLGFVTPASPEQLEGAVIFRPAPIVSGSFSFLREPDGTIGIHGLEARTETVAGGLKAVFTGDVRLTQGDFALTCDRLEIIFGKESPASASRDGTSERSKVSKDIDKIRSITALGNVKIVDKEVMATAEKVVYDNMKRTLKLMGGPPLIWRGPDAETGDPIIIYLDDYRYLDGDRAQLKRGALP